MTNRGLFGGFVVEIILLNTSISEKSQLTLTEKRRACERGRDRQTTREGERERERERERE